MSQHDESASHEDIQLLSQTRILDEQGVASASAILCRPARHEDWYHDGYRGLLGLGVVHVLTGIVFFFAANWALLTKWERLVPIFTVMSLTGVLGWLREGTFGGRLLLTVSTVLVGVFMAVFGQIYQTGADSWTLFANWAALSALWVFASQFRPLFLMWFLIVQTAVLLHCDQVLEVPAYWSSMSCALICLAALMINHCLSSASPRWFRRALSTNALLMCILPMVEKDHFVALAFVMVLLTVVLWKKRFVEDFYQVTLAVALGIFGATLLFSKHVLGSSDGIFGMFMLIGGFVSVLVGGSVTWLRSEWRARL